MVGTLGTGESSTDTHPQHPPSGPGAPSGPVLVVNDEPQILAFVRLALEDEGYAVVTAGDGAAALAVLETARPCAILLDLQMPGMGGLAFVEEYRRRQGQHRTDGAPIIVFTASRVPLEAASDMGVEGVLRKPFAVDELIVGVASHIASYQRDRAN